MNLEGGLSNLKCKNIHFKSRLISNSKAFYANNLTFLKYHAVLKSNYLHSPSPIAIETQDKVY